MDTSKKYDHEQCQSLFGYAYRVHLRSGGVCQLCGAGETRLSFELWRQLTVEHLVGKAQGGCLEDIRAFVSELMPELDVEDQEGLAHAIDVANMVTACSFCNATTSRHVSDVSMRDLIESAVSERRELADIAEWIATTLRAVLHEKRKDMAWKLEAIRDQYEEGFLPAISSSRKFYRGFEGGSVHTSEQDGKYLIIIDQGALIDFLPEDERDGFSPVRVIELSSESERVIYLRKHFGKPESRSQ